MKAWKVQDKKLDYPCCTVVFAETPASAKSVAKSKTVFGKYMDWVDFRVTRCKELDGEYRGHDEMEWDDAQDRRALVRAGFGCFEVDLEECESCVGRAECMSYKEYIASYKEYITEML